jgi:antitoxin component HigA of HigAB toxin-antitoxin module
MRPFPNSHPFRAIRAFRGAILFIRIRHNSTASRLLRGERALNANHIRNIAKALHIAPELLI